ncbi:MAG: TA system VapC family ribonuclease toxin [Prosthecobacter sp.]
MSHLLDTNVLVAACWKVHAHHGATTLWLANQTRFATCSSVQCGFLRVSLSPAIGASFDQASMALAQITDMPEHSLVVDDISASTLPTVSGHKEVMDAHLVCLAQRHGLKLATLDQALCTKPWAQGVAEFIG